MVNRVIAAIGGDGDDFGFASCSSLGVLDAVGFSGVVRAEFAGTNDDLEISRLIKTFGFTRVDTGNDAFERNSDVGSSDCASGWVVGAGCRGFDVRDVLAPIS